MSDQRGSQMSKNKLSMKNINPGKFIPKSTFVVRKESTRNVFTKNTEISENEEIQKTPQRQRRRNQNR